MPCDFETAYDTITNRVLAEWDAATIAVVGFPVEMRFKGVEPTDKGGKIVVPKTHFARFSMLQVVEPEITIRNGEFGKRYEHMGNIIIQCFAERQNIRAEEIGRKLARAALDIFRGNEFDGGINFHNCRVNDLEPEQKFQRFNMVAEYHFDEIA